MFARFGLAMKHRSARHRRRSPRHPGGHQRRHLLEPLEPRRLLADVSEPAILEWFETPYTVIEQRLPDLFATGYGSLWLPPPGRADSGDQSVGYDVYDRFDLGTPHQPTLLPQPPTTTITTKSRLHPTTTAISTTDHQQHRQRYLPPPERAAGMWKGLN